MYYGDAPLSRQPITHFFNRKPVPHYETKFSRPSTTLFQKKVALVFLTGWQNSSNQINQTKLEKLERFIIQEPWVGKGDFIIFVTTSAPEKISKWVENHFKEKPCVVLDEIKFQKIITAYKNPTATGELRRSLLQVAGPNYFDVFKWENQVDIASDIFVGRQTWINTILNDNRCYAIYGGRKIGKSSLLTAIRREMDKPDKETTTIYVSLEGSAVDDISVCKEILQKLHLNYEINSPLEFRMQINQYLYSRPVIHLVIFLDEVDKYILECKKDSRPHGLFKDLRAMSQEHKGRFRIIVAGFVELWKMIQNKNEQMGSDNPYFNMFHSLGPLKNLDSSDAQLIVAQGFQGVLGYSFENDTIPRKVIEYTTAHPAFVQNFCGQLHQYLAATKATQIKEIHLENVFKDRSPENFLDFVNNTLSQNLDILSRLLVYLIAINITSDPADEKRKSFSLEDIRRLVNSYNPSFAKIADDLWDESLNILLVTNVIKPSAQHNYSFTVPSYPQILKEYDAAKKDNIFKLMNEIESMIKKNEQS